MEPIKLNLGCGKDIRDGYTNLDIDPISDKVQKHDVEDLSDFADNSVSEILAFDIIEHFPLRKINPIIKEWCRVLHPGGKLVIQTPDIEVIFNDYYKQALAGQITWTRFSTILHGKDEPFQTHYVSLSFQWLKEILEQYNMTIVTKEKTSQNMKVVASKKAISDNDNGAAEAPKKRLSEVTASKLCMLRLRLVRSIRSFYGRHGIVRKMQLNKVSEFFIKWVILPKVRGPIAVPISYGFNLIVDPKNDIGLERQIFETGSYETGTLHVISKCLRKGDTFLDVGSNIGLMSLLAAKVVGCEGQVYAFEPESQTFAILSRNIEINGFKNIKAHELALGASSSTARIFRQVRKREAATLIGPAGNTTGGKEVPIETLDKFINEKNISNVRMIKIDVQGWELEVLKGAPNILSNPDAPIICIDYSDLHSMHGGLLRDVYDTICASNQYRIFKLQHGKDRAGQLVEIEGPEQLPSFDNLFCFTKEHIKGLDTSMFCKGKS